MRKRWEKRKVLLMVCCLLAAVSFYAVRAGAAGRVAASGQCAQEPGSVSWALDEEGTLTIFGKGNMSEDGARHEWPWDGLKDSIQKIVIKEGVTQIGWMAFKDCRNLRSVSIHEGVKAIGAESFSGCSSLEAISFPEGVSEVSRGVCQGCSNLRSVTIPHSVKEIGEKAFYGCSSLSQIKCDFNNWKKVGRMSFYGCVSLRQIKLVAEEIGTGAFQGCASLESVIFGSRVDVIGVKAFKDCTSLRKVFFPNGIRKIEEMAFYGCSKLKRVEFWGKPELEAYVFGNCKCTIYSRFFETYAKNRGLPHKNYVGLKKPKNKVEASNITITADENKSQKFLINVKAKDDAALFYFCPYNKVEVGTDGLVTVKKAFCGKIKIGITAVETPDYAEGSKEITLTVRPTPVEGISVQNTTARKLAVKWEKNGLGSGYQLQYSTDKKFKKAVVTKNINKNSATSAVFEKLKKGKTYYVRIRTTKKTGKTSIYSEWSGTKSVKITV